MQDKCANEKKSVLNASELLAPQRIDKLAKTMEAEVHQLKEGIICKTDYRARKRSPLDLVLDATEGFIPLWAEDSVLRWRFNAASRRCCMNRGYGRGRWFKV